MTGRQDFYYASSFTDPFQKQPPEVFCKKRSSLIAKFHRKTPLLESVFNKSLESRQTQVFSGEICGIFKNTYYEEHLGTIASALPRIYKT